MSAAAPYVTVGDTPNCDACKSYYSERFCEDCDQYLCTWCNLDIHVPIGARNHHRPRLYGQDRYAHLDGPAISTADRAVQQATQEKQKQQEGNKNEDSLAQNKYTFDPLTGRVNITTEHFLDLPAEDAWDLLGDWDAPYLPFSVDVNDAGDRRVLSLPPLDDSVDGDPILVTERLIQRDEREMFYSYSRLVPPGVGFPYTDLMSKFAFVPVTSKGPTGAIEKKCCLQWTTSVLPNDELNPKAAADAVASQNNRHTRMHTARRCDDDEGKRCRVKSSLECRERVLWSPN